MRICRKSTRILSLIFLILFMTTHAYMVVFDGIKPIDLSTSLLNIWLGSITSNYDYLQPLDQSKYMKFIIFVFSLITTIIVMNLLSTYLQIILFGISIFFSNILFFGSRICKWRISKNITTYRHFMEFYTSTNDCIHWTRMFVTIRTWIICDFM